MTVRARVHETSSTTGLGSYRLEGTSLGNRPFADAFADGDSVVYFAVAEDGSAWEEVRGTFTAPDTLSRDEVLDSSGGTKINWEEGVRNIFSAYSAKLMSAAPGYSVSQPLSLLDGRAEPHCFQHRLDTEAATSSDSCTHLETENFPDGCLLLLRQQDPGRAVTLSHGAGGAGQILLADGQDYTFADTADCILLAREGDDWIEVMRQRHDSVSRAGDTMTGALVLGAPGGGAQGDGTLNAEGVYVHGTPVVTDTSGLVQKSGDTISGQLTVNGPNGNTALNVSRGDNGPTVTLQSSLTASTSNLLAIDWTLNNAADTPSDFARISAYSDTLTSGAEDGRLTFRVKDNGALTEYFSIDGQTRFVRTHGVDFGSRTTNPTATGDDGFLLRTGGASYFSLNGGGSPFYIHRSNPDNSSRNILTFLRNGSTTATITASSTTVNYNTSSDERKKKDFAPVEQALDMVRALRPTWFTWRETEERHVGFVAQWCETCVPWAVCESEPGEHDPEGTAFKQMDYSQVTGVLAAGLIEAADMIDELKARVEALESV